MIAMFYTMITQLLLQKKEEENWMLTPKQVSVAALKTRVSSSSFSLVGKLSRKLVK